LAISNFHYNQNNYEKAIQNNYEKAMLFASRAEEISGAPASASFMKGRAMHQLGYTEDALKAYGNAIKLDKNYAPAYFNRGMLKLALKRKRSACEDFQLAKCLEYEAANDAILKYCK